MALNPNIALQTQGIQLPDFAGAYERVMNNRVRREGMEQNRQLHQAQMRNIEAQERQRKLDNERQARLDAAYQTGDVEAIRKVDPKLASDLDKSNTEKLAADRKAQSDLFEMASKKADRALKLIGGIADDTTLRAAIGQIQSDPEMSKAVPVDIMLKMAVEGYTPENANVIKRFGVSLLSEKEKVELARTKQAMELAEKQEQRAAALAGPQLKKAVNEAEASVIDPVTRLTADKTATLAIQRDQLRETKRHNERMEKFRGSELYLQSQKMEADKVEKATKEKAMSQESAKVYAIADTIVPELEQLKEAIKARPRKAIAGILTGTDTKLARLAENAADKVGRLRSGGAVNPNEEARFMAQIARKMDIVDGDGKSAIEAIDGYINEARTVRTKMMPGGGTASSPTPSGNRPPLSSFYK